MEAEKEEGKVSTAGGRKEGRKEERKVGAYVVPPSVILPTSRRQQLVQNRQQLLPSHTIDNLNIPLLRPQLPQPPPHVFLRIINHFIRPKSLDELLVLPTARRDNSCVKTFSEELDNVLTHCTTPTQHRNGRLNSMTVFTRRVGVGGRREDEVRRGEDGFGGEEDEGDGGSLDPGEVRGLGDYGGAGDVDHGYFGEGTTVGTSELGR